MPSRVLRERYLFFGHKDTDGFALFVAFLDNKGGAAGAAVPKGQYQIAVGDDIKIAQQRGFAAMLLIVGQKFGQLDTVLLGIV